MQYPASSSLVTNHGESSTRRAISAAEGVMAPHGPSALMLPRFVGRLLLKQTRYRVRDAFNDISYHPRRWFVAYRVFLAALVAGFLALLVAWLTSRRTAAAEEGALASDPGG
jgi:hypothetical protein